MLDDRPPMGTPTISALLAQKRQALAQLQEDIAALERAQALLAGSATARPQPQATATPAPRPAPGHPLLRVRVLELLKASPTPLSPSGLHARLVAGGRRVNASTLRHLLVALVRKGVLRQPHPGLYALADTPGPSSASPVPKASRPAPRPPRSRPTTQPGPAATTPKSAAARSTATRQPLRTVVLGLLKSVPTPLRPQDIRARLRALGRPVSVSALSHLFPVLRQQGLIRRVGPGRYTATARAATTAAR